MNGSRIMLDTNAIISFLKGNEYLFKLISKAEWIGVSIISIIEFLSFKDISENDKILFKSFCLNITVCDIEHSNQILLNQIVEIRKQFKIKLPDAIIIANCLSNDATMVSNDKEFSKNSDLSIITF